MDIKKPLRAKKTMAHSSRKQVEMLNGIKNGKGAALSDENHVHLKTAGSNCLYYNPPKGLACSSESKQTQLSAPLEEPVANLIVNSEISIYKDSQGVSQNDSTCAKNADVEQFWDGNTLQDILYDLYTKESQSPLFKPVKVHLSTKPGRQQSDELEDPFLGTSPVLERSHLTADETLTLPVLKPGIDDGSIADAPLPLDQSPHASSHLPEDRTQRKRKNSGTSSKSLSKHTRAAGEASGTCDSKLEREPSGLEKVKCFIQKQLDVSVENVDHSLQLLNERIDRTHCLRKHEEITINIVKKISRLERRINAAISFQKAELSRKAQSQNKTLNTTNNLPDNTSNEFVLARKRPADPNNTPSEIAESSDNPHRRTMSQRAEEQAADAAGVKEKLVPTKRCTSAKAPGGPKNLLLIDLTDEGNSERDGREEEQGAANQQDASSEILVIDSPEPAFQPSSEFSHLPPLPTSHLHPVHNGGFRNTLPPPKLDLDVVRVQKPKGIALQWNVKRLDPRCAPIDSFHLFVCLEQNQDGVVSNWSKIGQIPAHPLPMACSLASFPSFVNCYFAIQAKDIYGRYGPFCDIQSISAG